MFAEMVQKLREEHGYSRQKLGELTGVSSTAVYKWEHGLAQPGVDTLRRLAEIFGVSMDELCCFEKPEDQGTIISVMNRAVRQMTREEQEKYLAVGRTLFAHAFEEDDESADRR